MKDNGIKHVAFSTADGALEAAPAVRDVFVLLEVVSLCILIIKHIIDCSVFWYNLFLKIVGFGTL